MTYTSYWDFDAFHKQMKSLRFSIDNVKDNIYMVPAKYRDNEDIMGAIINYVFQGENTTKNKDVEIIGKRILLKLGRYDKETKQYKPYINN